MCFFLFVCQRHGVQEPPHQASRGSQVGVHRTCWGTSGGACFLSPDIHLPPKRLPSFTANMSHPRGSTSSTRHDLHTQREACIFLHYQCRSRSGALRPAGFYCARNTMTIRKMPTYCFFSCPFPVSQNTAEGGGMKGRCNDL